MRRHQLFEFNDTPQVPDFIQEAILETLGEVLDRGRIIDALFPHFAKFAADSGVDELLDLGAGSARVARILARSLAAAGMETPRIVLTDLHPRPALWESVEAASGGRITSVRSPVDALAIPADVSRGRGRMIINAIHHFPPELVRGVLADTVRSGAPIFLAEGFDRELSGFLPFARLGTGLLLTNPLRARRRRIARAICTWVVPVIPVAAVWDGLVSTARVHTLDELHAMARSIAPSWRWEGGDYTFPAGGRGIWFRGLPG